MLCDEKRHSIILFGGVEKEGLVNDTWELKLPMNLSTLIVDITPTP
jgi:hypothetical protein